MPIIAGYINLCDVFSHALPVTSRTSCHARCPTTSKHLRGSINRTPVSRSRSEFAMSSFRSLLLLLLPLLLPLLVLLEPRLTAAAKIPEAEVKVEVKHRPFLCHRKSKRGDLVAVSYKGYLDNGSLFHSTDDHNNGHPVWVTLGVGEVIRGWDRGLVGMCVGEKRHLTVPPALAYGKEGKGRIPPDATLVFDMELHEIRNGPRSHESFQEMDLDDDWKLSRTEVEEYLRKEFGKTGVNHTESYQGLVDDIFSKEDEDEDGFISSREFTYRHDEL